MPIEDTTQLFILLQQCIALKERHLNWWPGYGTFDVLVGAILTQNTKFSNVERSLRRMHDQGVESLDTFLMLTQEEIEHIAQPSGFFRQKSRYLIGLVTAIKKEFESFECFVNEVDASWLLHQKGIGKESRDAILCYACERNIMVVDSYSFRFMAALGWEFEEYEALQSWFMQDDRLNFATYHGLIVEYCKLYSKKKIINITPLLSCMKEE